MTADDALMTIGEFARRSRLPASTLRYYHQRGLLVPSRVDSATGYRYYRPSQLEMAALVGELRQIGVPPEAIAIITQADVGAAEALRAERARIESEIDHRARAIAAIDRLVDRLGAVPAAGCSMSVRRLQVVPAVRGPVHSQSASTDVRRLMVGLRRRLRAGGVTPRRYGALFPLDLDAEPMPTIVFAPDIDGLLGPPPPTEVPGGAYATTEHRGDLALGTAYAALFEWMDAGDLRPAGPVIEEYLGDRRSPHTRVSIGVAS
jgi:DNA-binding transcriptional MerR regulator